MVTTRSGRSTSGLKAFNKARDAALAQHGIAGFPGLTEATRAEYAKAKYSKDFQGWNKARGAVLTDVGLRGYPGLMTAAKAEYGRQLMRSPQVVNSRRADARAADKRTESLRGRSAGRSGCTPHPKSGAPRVRMPDGSCRVPTRRP